MQLIELQITTYCVKNQQLNIIVIDFYKKTNTSKIRANPLFISTKFLPKIT